MSALPIKSACLVVTVDDERRWIVDGQVVVWDGSLRTVELPRVVETHNRLARALPG